MNTALVEIQDWQAELSMKSDDIIEFDDFDDENVDKAWEILKPMLQDGEFGIEQLSAELYDYNFNVYIDVFNILYHHDLNYMSELAPDATELEIQDQVVLRASDEMDAMEYYWSYCYPGLSTTVISNFVIHVCLEKNVQMYLSEFELGFVSQENENQIVSMNDDQNNLLDEYVQFDKHFFETDFSGYEDKVHIWSQGTQQVCECKALQEG